LDPLQIVAIAVGLAMDAFSVAIATGLALEKITFRQYFRLSYHFGLFQFLMPILGWYVGSTVAGLISELDHWIAFALLAYVGGKMIAESFEGKGDASRGDSGTDDGSGVPRREVKDPTRGASLIMLSVATSIDALAVGLSLAFLEVSIFLPSVVIGIVTASLTFLGMRIGHHAGQLLGPWMERLGGVILIGIGLKTVLDHVQLFGG
jgi:manganese efflux pump family protein